MNEELLAQIINGMRMNQPQGAVGNVSNNELARFVADPMNNTDAINAMRAVNNTGGAVGNVSDNEMTMFSGNPMNGAVAGGNVGNVSDREMSMFNKMAGGISNPMPRINEMRNNLATAGSVGNASNNEAEVMNQAANEMRAIQEKGAAGNGILSQDEINRFVYLRNMLNPNLRQQAPVGMPTDIDGASAGGGMSQKELDILLQQIQRMR